MCLVRGAHTLKHAVIINNSPDRQENILSFWCLSIKLFGNLMGFPLCSSGCIFCFCHSFPERMVSGFIFKYCPRCWMKFLVMDIKFKPQSFIVSHLATINRETLICSLNIFKFMISSFQWIRMQFLSLYFSYPEVGIY